jgi:hypothetical protein
MIRIVEPSLVLRPRPEQQPLLAGFAILLVLSVALPLSGYGSAPDFGSVFAWIAFCSALLAATRPLRSRIVVGESLEIRDPAGTATFSDVIALYVWNRYLGVCDTGGITIVRLRARWTVKQFECLAATLGVPLTVRRDGIPKAATGPQMIADIMAGGTDVAGSDVVIRDAGKHEADVSRLVRILSDSPPSGAGPAPRVGLRDASSAEVAKAAAALLDAGAQIRLERPRALR